MESSALGGRLTGALFEECAGWIWEQIQAEGGFAPGELIEIILQVERALGVQAAPLPISAAAIESELARRGEQINPPELAAQIIRTVLEWEDDFLAYAGIPRAES
jgi:hypothetical protein